MFCPLIRLPFVGSVNYIGHGERDGIILLVIAALALVLVIGNVAELVWVPGLVSLALIGYTLYQLNSAIQTTQAEMHDRVAGNPFGGFVEGLAHSVEYQWGWVVLVAGGVLLIVSGLLMDTQAGSREPLRMPCTAPRLATCPFCAERIYASAKVCKHCKRDLVPGL